MSWHNVLVDPRLTRSIGYGRQKTLPSATMLGRFRRRLSRTKSVGVEADHLVQVDSSLKKTFSLTPSDEQLFSKLTFTDDTNLDDRPPRKLNPSIHSHVSAATTSSQRTVINSVDSGILSLPTEVLLALQEHLTSSSEVALRHSCARFLHLFKTPSFYLSGDERFDFLCMTERDQDPENLERLVCGVCRDLHMKSSFPATEKPKGPERDCRQVWLCPHKSLGYEKTVKIMKAGHEAPFRSENIDPCSRCRDVIRCRSIADRPEKGTSIADLESANAASLLITKIALLQMPAPQYGQKTTNGGSSYKEVFGVKAVSDALIALDFPICSHLRLSDPYMLSRFCRACINTQKLPEGVRGPPCISEAKRDVGDPDYLGKCKQSCYTRGCKTRFMFQARESLAPDNSGRRQIWLILVIYRWLGPLQSSGPDTLWKQHTVNHAERLQMRKKWEVLEKTRSRKPMPNWSICLLHPEDSTVRSEHSAYRPANYSNVEDALKGVITNMSREKY